MSYKYKIIDFVKYIFNKETSRSCIVIDKYRTVYVPINKVASTSLKKYAYEVTTGGDPSLSKPLLFRSNKKSLKNKYKGYYKFAFVRNPWARVVSFYLNKTPNPRWVEKNRNKYLGIYKDIPFEEVVEIIFNTPDTVSDRHFRSQHTFIEDKEGNILVDFVGKLEKFDEDFSKICTKTGMPFKKIDKTNASNAEHYGKYYNEKTREMVRERFKEDIERFGYKFNLI